MIFEFFTNLYESIFSSKSESKKNEENKKEGDELFEIIPISEEGWLELERLGKINAHNHLANCINGNCRMCTKSQNSHFIYDKGYVQNQINLKNYGSKSNLTFIKPIYSSKLKTDSPFICRKTYTQNNKSKVKALIEVFEKKTH